LLGCAGDIGTVPQGAGTPDASATPIDSPAPPPPDAAPLLPDAPACVAAVTANIGDGHHNAGQDCMQGCHVHGFTVAGTMFTSVNSHIPIIGATVRVLDSANKTVDIVTQANGNFYTATPVTFPITVLATSCPNLTHMSGQVTGGIVVGGTTAVGCNKTGCHVSGTFQIHLP
jgi:hypothetical protein